MRVYRSPEAAAAGDEEGGTGFIVTMPSRLFDGVPRSRGYAYFVTNTHVIAGGFPVVRVATRSGKQKVRPLAVGDWFRHPDGDDVAVCPMPDDAEVEADELVSIAVKDLMTLDWMREFDIGAGDRIFMLSRLRDRDGADRNEPVVRFGTLARTGAPKILNAHTGIRQESFIAEMHSMPGHSGSPVFVHVPPYEPRFGVASKPGTRLLGIDWGHFDGSRMATVVPAWKILETLQMEELVEQREAYDAKLKREPAAVPDSKVAQETGFTRSDFENALEKASRKVQPSQSDEEKS